MAPDPSLTAQYICEAFQFPDVAAGCIALSLQCHSLMLVSVFRGIPHIQPLAPELGPVSDHDLMAALLCACDVVLDLDEAFSSV